MRLMTSVRLAFGRRACQWMACLLAAVFIVELAAVDCEAQRGARREYQRQLRRQVQQQRRLAEEQAKLIQQRQQALLEAMQQAELERRQKRQEAAAARRQAREERRERLRNERRERQRAQEEAREGDASESALLEEPSDLRPDPDPVPEFDGRVLRADAETGSIWIDLGQEDEIAVGEVFQVYRAPPAADAPTERSPARDARDARDERRGTAPGERHTNDEGGAAKRAASEDSDDEADDDQQEPKTRLVATIKVTQLLGPHVSEARIVRQEPGGRIAPGDQIAAWELADDEPTAPEELPSSGM